MGRHRTLENVRRGVARWPVVVAGVATAVALAWIGWTWIGDRLEQRAVAQSKTCPEGDIVVRVAVAPSAAGAVDEAAKRWNAEKTVVNDHCVRVDVAAHEPSQVFAGLTGDWNEQTMGGEPQAWLPESTYWVNRLAAADSALIGSNAESVATSPVVLAVPYEAVQPLEDGDSFTFGDLAALTTAPDGWARYGKPEWGKFTVAMPDPTSNTASVLALQCAIAGVSPQRAGPVTVETLTLPEVQQNLTQLAAARPANVPGTTVDALMELGKAGKVQGAPFSAVPVTEVDLYRRNLGLDGKPKPAAAPLYEVAARGPSPAADFPFVAMSGDQAQIRAALKFRDFLKHTAQQEMFNRIGLRAAGGAGYPREAPGIRWDSATTSLVPADATTTQQISATWANAADGGQVITVLVDVSRSMRTQGRIDEVKQALHGLTDRLASGALGIWEFSRRLDAGRPYRQLVPASPVATSRPALHTAIDALKPATGTHLYTSLDAVYQAALSTYAEGKRNRVVVITDGPNDGGMTYSQLRERLRDKNVARGKLPISFLSIGSDLNRRELTELSRSTGGTVSVLTDASGVDGALGQLLSAEG
ncbi:substrate-binding domain-containing protein [Kibdelosporangium persicum]|uniref:von Willebrand factor type A n=1 Tax=Kibdelosporangium persicum TaxID=2698649 RepID=A0ABX2EVT4_9PSEU|nr:substrate-binding domain-containing protein [Kibdelosporangium persicum]NRN63079.1 von Willebrand factor type A [Kibdelosporangium persicum]